MSEEFFQSKVAFIEKFQKKLMRNCFKRCFDAQSGQLDRDAFYACYYKYLETARVAHERMRDASIAYSTKQHMLLYFRLDARFALFMDDDFFPYFLKTPVFAYAWDRYTNEKV